MMLRPAPVTPLSYTRIPTFPVSPNKVVVPLSSTAPCLQLVTRKAPNFRSLCTSRSNADAKTKNSGIHESLERYEHVSSGRLPSGRFAISSSTKNSSSAENGDGISRSGSQWIISCTDITMDGDQDIIISGIILSPVSCTDITMDGDQDIIISGIILSPGICCGFSAPRSISVHATNGTQDGELAAVIDNVDRILDKFPEYHKIIIQSASQNVIDQLNRVFSAQFESTAQFESALKLKERLRDKVVVLKHLIKGDNKAAHGLGKHARFKPRTRIEYTKVDFRKIKKVDSEIDKYMCSWSEICEQAIKDGDMFLL